MHHHRSPPTQSPPPFRTLALTATLSIDSAAMRRLMEREVEAHRRRHGPRSAAILVSSSASTDPSDGEWTRQGWRIWWAPPTHWREEVIWPGVEPLVIIARPDVRRSYVPVHRTLYTSEPPAPAVAPRLVDRLRALLPRRRDPWESMQLSSVAERVAEFPLTNPRLPAAEWDLTTSGMEEYLGRTVRRVRATRRSGALSDLDDPRRSGYWSWLDEYEYLVDDALGILMRLTGLENGVPIGLVTADEVRVDASMPDDVFAFVPPAGTRIMHVKRRT